jgi:hypothetical protein
VCARCSLDVRARVRGTMTDPAMVQVHAPVRLPPVRRASYLFRRFRAQTSGYGALPFHTMK